MVLPDLYRAGILAGGSLQPSSTWQDQMVQHFWNLIASDLQTDDSVRLAYQCSAVLETIGCLSLSQEGTRPISNHLYAALKRAMQVDGMKSSRPIDILAAGNGFQFLVECGDMSNTILDIWPSLCSASPIYGHRLPFWHALLSFTEKNGKKLEMEGPHMVPFKQAIMNCIGSPSHDLRLTALRILEIIAPESQQLQDVIAIEQSPMTLETQRTVSMRIGQLSRTYSEISSDEWVGEAIPTFCFGLLHVRLASVWDDACAALKAICETKEGEGHVTRIAFKWLSQAKTQDDSIATAINVASPPRYVSEFQCTNVMQLEQLISEKQASVENAEGTLKGRFHTENAKVSFVNPFSRTQALRVLNSLPAVAEKRSRLLVPVLLDWALDQPTTASLADNSTGEELLDQDGSRWGRKDQKAMLLVFSKFTNPKVLYRSAEVYEALVALVGNGDVEIQKAALKAVLTWKEPAIADYQENLFNLLDDARFRDEISVFLDAGAEHSLVKEEHRDRLLPVLLRLLYGKVISGKKDLDVKRKAVFQALTRFEEKATQKFLSIALGPLSGITTLRDGVLDEELLQIDLQNPRKQVGMLTMLEDMVTTLKTTIRPFVALIVDPLLYCLIKASRCLSKARASENETDDVQDVQVSLSRTIRQRALHSLNVLFESCPDFAWDAYSPHIVKELVNPRLQQFPIETAQSISGLLRLFSAWSKSPLTAHFLVEYNPEILTKVVECLGVPSAKDEVKRFVLDAILRTLIASVADTDKFLKNRIHSEILQPYANTILSEVGDFLRKSPSREVLVSGVQTVAELAPHVVGSAESRSMIEISSFLLRQPSKRVNAPTKQGLLKILHEFIPRCDSQDMDDLFEVAFDATTPLFAFSQDRQVRTLLCGIVEDLASYKDELSPIADLCRDLNSFSPSRLDEPDFGRRSSAFDTINGDEVKSYTLTQWKPLVFNMLYFIKDNDELSIRVSASLSLQRFIEASITDDVFKPFISTAVLPGIQNGMRESSELVRSEFLTVLAQLVKTYCNWAPIADLSVLLSADEESSFYSNVLHIQGHRRQRALRRLGSHATQLEAGHIYHLLIPLLEHFVFDKADDESANSLAGETIKSIAALCQGLEWPQFRSLLKRYIGYLKSKEDMQKTIIKLLVGLMDSLNESGRSKGYIAGGSQSDKAPPSEGADEETVMDVDKPTAALCKTLPQQEKLTNDLVNNVLPELTEFLHNKDESTVSLRVPIAIAVTKVLLVLPPREIEARLPSLLLDICHILRSRSQDSRDMSRNTLTEIVTFTGPTYLSFVLKALRTALQRGYQLHVLSFTLHSILVKLSEQLKPGDLDYCLTDIVDVIMDDTFGITGQEKDAEDYISKMKEVKSSKSFDTMDLIARTATTAHLVDLVLPITSLLQENLGVRTVQKVDELLRRIGLGILQNPTVKDRDVLVFCYELIQEVYKASNSADAAPKVLPRNRKYLVNMKGAAKSGARHSATSYLYKATRFSLDILRTVLRKHEELQTPQNLAGFLPVIGDALIQGHEEVQISAIRLLSIIMGRKFPELDENCPVYVTEAVRAIKGAPSSNSEIAQASLKLISAVLRERPNVEVKERDLALLLKRIIPDLDEPDRQGVTFAFLRAIMNRKLVIAEIYEVMDTVAAMMVTNHTRSARDLARSSYFQFLMEYPQAKNRFKKQLEFLLKNLRYDYVEGRQSIMEALNLVLTKVGDNVLQDQLSLMFIPLIHSMANDDSSDCRTMAGALVKKILERADSQRLKSFTTDLRSWLGQDEDAGLKRLGIQCWGLYFEVADAKPKELAFVLEQLQSSVEGCLERRDGDGWELIYYSLTVFSKLCKSHPDTTLSSDKKSFWVAVQACVSYPHAWVKLTAAKLLGTYFADLASTNGDAGLDKLPLQGSRGLQLTEEDMLRLTNSLLKNLSMPNVSEDLCAQSVRNLAFLARCLAANGAKWNWQKVDDDDEVEDTTIDDANGVTNGDAESSAEEWGGFSPQPEEPDTKKSSSAPPTAIHRLMTRLSGLIRRETKIMKLASLYPKSATMTLLETLCTKLPVPSLTTSLSHLLTTLSTLVDPATTIPRSTDSAFNDTYRALIDKAREVMDVLQKRMGTPEYLKVIGDVQRGMRQRREERRQKRKIEAVAQPEKFARDKRRRNDVKRVKRQEKAAEYKGKRRGW